MVTTTRNLIRHSGRISANDSNRVLDEATRQRRLRKQLELLEQDNFHEDPHAQLQWHKNIPKFEEENVPVRGSSRRKGGEGDHGESTRRKRKLRVEHSKQRFRKNFVALMDEETLARFGDGTGREAYVNAQAPESVLPPRRFCTACGFYSKYTCQKCGAKYCSIRCRDLHEDTRCLKWTA
uniref:HIT-type domain-containing protein n=1 Tax=Syphacia muris TaxID=451379 RepID=A0A0N5AIZ5_9BILA